MKIGLLTIFLTLLLSNAGAQEVKREFEKSIKPTEAPDRVRVFMDFFFPEVKKPRYYQESDGEAHFYEVKFKWREMPLSVEFFPNGQLMDIENLIDFDELADSVRQEIEAYFQSEYQRYHFNRVQIQYSGLAAINVIEGLMLDDFNQLTLRYEIEAEVSHSTDSSIGSYEFLFNDKGKLLQKRPILKRSSDNVTY